MNTRQLNPLLLAIGLLMCAESVQGQSREAALPVSASSAIQEDVAAGRSFVGTVMPARVSTVGGAVAGRVAEFLVREGDRVQAGQVLARLLSQQVEIQLAGAKAELDLRRAALAELENGSRPEEIEQAKARLLRTETAWEYATARLERLESLTVNNAITKDQLQEAQTLAQQALQTYAEAKAAWELVKLGPRKERIAQSAASVAVQEQQVRSLEDVLEKHTIRAPFDGYVVEQFTEVGQWLPESGNVATIVELDEIEIAAPVLESYIPDLPLGTQALVSLPAIEGQIFEGQVSAIVRRADPVARTFPVIVRLKNEIRGDQVLLNPGMQARVTLPVGSVEQAVLVPKDAVVLGGRRPVVFVLSSSDDQGSVEAVPVELGLASGSLIAVSGGIQPGQKVIVQGNERLRDGQSVRVVEYLPARDQAKAAAVAKQP